MRPVRQPIAVKPTGRRRLAERLALRFPGLIARLTSLVFRASPESRLRRAAVRHAVRIGFEATNRGDYEAAFAFYHPDIEVREPPEVESLGLDRMPRGRAGRIQVQRRWQSEWGEIRFEPDTVFDLGDRMLVLGRMKGAGSSSGAVFDSELANLVVLSGGRAIREEMFLDHAKALQVAGLASPE